MHATEIVFATLIALLFQVLANSVTFVSQDDFDRIICWVPDWDSPVGSDIPETYVPAGSSDVVIYPVEGWKGQFHSIFPNGNCDAPTIIAEVTFQVSIFPHSFVLEALSRNLRSCVIHLTLYRL
jgi:hypothetical protein